MVAPKNLILDQAYGTVSNKINTGIKIILKTVSLLGKFMIHPLFIEIKKHIPK
ncbi:hypothetical protein LME05_04860 [Leuconostoc mesenteroides subsp. cremoris]|nr:hypothetical protein LME05_04860 [Leuconostoc mesenteroides subsp. cremoris]